MDIRIIGFKYKNIREFDDLEISFHKEGGESNTHHISLIQMPNGTGKTTTLNLIKHTLSGKKPSSDEIESFASKDSNDGFFELRVIINEEYFAFRLTFDYLNNDCKFYTTESKIEGGGRSEGHNLPLDVKPILTKEFVSLFVFDGELSKKLLDKQDSAAKNAIEVIYHLDQLLALNSTIDRIILETQKKKESRVKGNQGLTQRKTVLKNLKQTKNDLYAQKDKIESYLEKKRTKLTELEKQRDDYFDKYDDAKEQKDQIIAAQKDLSQSIIKNVKTILTSIHDPLQYSPFFNSGLSDLANNLIKLKLPATTSAEFFKELAHSKICICGEPIDDIHKQNILDNASKYLSEDDILVMNAVKSSISDILPFEKMDNLITELSNERDEFDGLKQNLDYLNAYFSADDKQKYEELDAKIVKCGEVIRECNIMLNLITTDTDTEGMAKDDNIHLCEIAIRKLMDEIKEATQTVKFTNQSEKLKKINDSIRKQANSEIKEQIIIESNQKIIQLLNKDNILIEDIGQSIEIKGKSGVSQGQSLAIAYAYLATLFDDSNYRIPFVIDSPAGALDIEVRREVSSIIPKLYDQLIIFILSGEREGFIDGIESNKDIQYLTIYKDNDAIHTHQNKDYFMSFQSEENYVSAQ